MFNWFTLIGIVLAIALRLFVGKQIISIALGLVIGIGLVEGWIFLRHLLSK